jgi:hypothetical protein
MSRYLKRKFRLILKRISLMGRDIPRQPQAHQAPAGNMGPVVRNYYVRRSKDGRFRDRMWLAVLERRRSSSGTELARSGKTIWILAEKPEKGNWREDISERQPAAFSGLFVAILEPIEM